MQFFLFLETVIDTVPFASNELRMSEAPRNSRNKRTDVLNKALDNTSSEIRHSSRIRIPNSRFGYLLPGFLEQSGNGKRRNNMKTSNGSKKYNVFQDFNVNTSITYFKIPYFFLNYSLNCTLYMKLVFSCSG